MLALIESTARATIKHNDSEPIASAAATASVNREEAVVALWLLKPAAPDGRIMVWILSRRGRITCDIEKNLATLAGNIGAAAASKNGRNAAKRSVMPAIPLAIKPLDFLWLSLGD
jgi:hypothetical protein